MSAASVTAATASPTAAPPQQTAAACELDALRRRFPPRQVPATWPGTATARSELEELMARPPVRLEKHGSAMQQLRGLRLVLDWLESVPGDTWQQRWAACGAEQSAGDEWWALAEARLGERGCVRRGIRSDLQSGLLVLGCLDAIRPGTDWTLRGRSAHLTNAMARVRDPHGFAALRELVREDQMLHSEGPFAIAQIAKILLCKGGRVADIVPGDCVQVYDLRVKAGVRATHASTAYLLLQRLGVLPPDAPATFRALSSVPGRRDLTAIVDDYRIACQPVRALILDYLRERQPALDYSSLRALAATLAGRFWADLERHHPGIDSLHLSPEVAAGWKARQRVKTRTVRRSDGTVAEVTEPRLSDNEMVAVRAFYQDLAQWALEEPARWGTWVAPCPVRDSDIDYGKRERWRKARMDQRTRERLPIVPALAATAAERRNAAAARLAAARAAAPGTPFACGGEHWYKPALRVANPAKVWAEEPDTGRRRDLVFEEHEAFWSWAVIETLRNTGVRVEELLEISHQAITEYRLPSTGELVPLLQIAPSKSDAERLLLISPELADVLSAVVTRVRRPNGAIPQVASYDRHERTWNAPMPLLFQWQYGGEHRALTNTAVAAMLNNTLAATDLTDETGAPLRITPHDFRRIFITDVITNGLPPHIAQVIAGHNDIDTTMRYKAVYPHEAIEAYRGFIARRRALRPGAEYRTPTEAEWDEFLAHFEKRKLSAGICARAFGTPCVHEHACIRCSLLRPDPAQRHRLTEIRDNLEERIAEAEREGWLGEIEGLRVSLAGAHQKIAQIDSHLAARSSAVHLDMPRVRDLIDSPAPGRLDQSS